ncbi:MAG: YfhO family protein, partial [Planctomycetota bacterium]
MPLPWSRARVVLALLVVPALLFGPMVAAGEVFLPFLPTAHEPLASENPAAAAEALRAVNATMGDRVYPFLVDQLAARAELARGAAPTWEPLQTLGMPLFAGNVAALGYPLNWLAFLFPPERMAAPLAALSLFLAGLGAWLFLTRLELDRRAALVGALGMQLGAFALANLHYYMKVDSALWFPWALWAVEGLARGKRWSASALVLALALALLGGMVTIGAFVFAATALYALLRLGPFAPEAAERKSPLFAAALCFVLGGAGAAYWLLPLAERAANSSRGAVSFEGTVATSLAPTTVLGLVVPDLVGPPGDPTPSASLPLAWWLTPASMSARAEHANTREWDLHARLVLVLLGLVGVVARPRRAAFPAILSVVCVGFAQAWP